MIPIKDETDEIQKALDKADAERTGIVVLGSGLHRTTRPLILPNFLCLKGVHQGALGYQPTPEDPIPPIYGTVLFADHTGPAIQTLSVTAGGYSPFSRIEDLTIWGGGVHWHNGGECSGLRNVTITDVQGRPAFYHSGQSKKLTLNDVNLTRCEIPIRITGGSAGPFANTSPDDNHGCNQISLRDVSCDNPGSGALIEMNCGGVVNIDSLSSECPYVADVVRWVGDELGAVPPQDLTQPHYNFSGGLINWAAGSYLLRVVKGETPIYVNAEVDSFGLTAGAMSLWNGLLNVPTETIPRNACSFGYRWGVLTMR